MARRPGGRLRKTALDRRLQAEARAAKLAGLTPAARLRRRLGWPLCFLGAGLFAATFVASFAGTVVLPFDHHHVIGQLGGGVLALTGLVWATS